MDEIILMSDPRVAAVPVRDDGQPLVDVEQDGTLLVDARRREGFRLLFVEGYRPLALQRAYFEEYAAGLRAAHPDWPRERVHSAASRCVSPPGIAPHSAGAAVDLTLADADGTELDLGTPVNASPEASAGACCTRAAGVGGRARAHREVLGAALTAAGLVDYPTE
ncbi:D-alanyl-D-alanine dipeptidase [Streptomyces sp. enrichment culture]